MKGENILKNIYLDWAATSPICPVAKQAILEHIDDFGNPSSSYELGVKSRIIIEDARAKIAKCINAEPNEIYFTSGGSESDTWALNGRTSLISSIEHSAIKSPFRFKVDNDGIADIEDTKKYINTLIKKYGISIVSCMMINNEIGTIQPIKELVEMAHENNLLFFTDAVQAMGHIPIDVKDLNVDMLSASGHKFGAPKGIGFLYIKNGTEIHNLIKGGKQESGLRPSTENILGITSMAAALEDSVFNMEERNEHIKKLRDKMLDKLLSIDGVYLNGSLEQRIVSNINICIDGVRGSTLVAMCDLNGICISAGSACHEGESTPSHVLTVIGLFKEDALNSVRITIGYQNTEEEIDKATDIITYLIKRIREEQ